MSTDEGTGLDLLARVADLIRDVGERAQAARCYRALLTTIAEPIFDRALALGSEVRRAARGAHPEAALAAAIAELQTLQSRCDDAIATVRQSPQYRDASASFWSGAPARVAAVAPAIFASVTPYEPHRALYWPIPLSPGRRGPHFLPAEECAAWIRVIAAEGLPAPTTPPTFGGDETINPVVLNEEHDGSESPLALAYEPSVLPGPLCRVEGSGTVLFYAPRLHAAAQITCHAAVDDEWWRVRPDSYREYLKGLERALEVEGLGIRLTIVA